MKQLLLLAVTFSCFFNLTNAQPGKLNTSFGNGGIVKTDLGEANIAGTFSAEQVQLLPDGGMYVLQEDISKRHSDGSLDSGFGINGFVKKSSVFDRIYKMAVAPDDKIVIEVLDSAYNFFIARYNTNGTPDSSFSKDGKIIIDQYSDVLAVQKNGKIIISGLNGDHIDNKFFFKRYNIDGSKDKTFDGSAITHIDPTSVVFQKDGKIVVAGNLWILSHSTLTSYIALARYNTNGSLDYTFGRSGVAKSDVRGFTEDVAIQNDGKIIVGTFIDSKVSFLRYNKDGTSDLGFAGTGKLITDIHGSVNTLHINPNTGKIIVLFIDIVPSVIQLNINGAIDSSFHQTSTFSLASIAVLPDGKIVAAGGADNGLCLARYNTNGSSDTTFHEDGTYTEANPSGNMGYKSIAVQKDGKIVAAGSKWNGKNYDFAIARYNTNGSPDNTFSRDGIQTTDFTSNNDYARVVVVQKDGKIIVAGEYNIARYNADGSLDNTFSGDGRQTTNAVNINSMAVQSDGKIVVAGAENYISDIYAKSYSALARFNTDGSTDSTFGVNGRQTLEQGVFGTYGRVSSLVIQNDGKIVIAGVFSLYYKSQSAVVVARLNTNGSLDIAYHGTGTKVYSANTSFALAKQDDDKIIISVSNSQTYLIDRLTSKGYVDNSFKEMSLKGLQLSKINSIALQSDGKIVLGTDSLLRFNIAGTLDSAFNGNGIQSPPFAIKNMIIGNNKLYIAGGERYGTIAEYLTSSTNTPPAVSITNPVNNQTIAGPTNIHLKAVASDSDGTISKVEFYSDTTLLHTEYVSPYGCTMRHLSFGNYSVTAKAYDNSGNVATSAAVHFNITSNQAPLVSIISPANHQVFADTATIHFEAAANDTDGRITRVEFYKDSTLLRTEYKYPYTYNWTNVVAGTYVITAKATDNYGAQTTSAPVIVKVTSGSAIVSSKPYSENKKTALNDALHLRLSPNPATNIVNIYIKELQQNKPATLSIISVSGIVLKTMQISNSVTQLDVSTLTSGVYTIKLVCGDRVVYKPFVKL